jgi:hypothetical protein
MVFGHHLGGVDGAHVDGIPERVLRPFLPRVTRRHRQLVTLSVAVQVALESKF